MESVEMMESMAKSSDENVSKISSEELKAFINRLEKLEDEKNTICGYIRDVYSEAKAEGFDPKIMRKVLKIRSMKYEEVLEEEELVETYMQALKS
ncbi:MAG: DUF2312 domain-containing protein [Holosporales bacterium]|jgi:uncharacterized protein (UPF0335 family)|nr:DUF2312 domain-containing protein [Holosporales bacterium]